ncbi:4-hydroxy 2-oxovalerate aldolase [Psychrobacillus insolitus]|uniref:4-hydroxy-2-oxovalerate aldolase n=1 Tax=Psychrobacillus insolitus TaxID=1461 RepID=A0A2W7MMH1_9BACI|nr:4-hydroxy-2-oxovalerate aldolase [Psychrobacillus insolitus]PZX08327.1 4-hydroxy 2-oxovalerate aldolase [Psychrobacillus insolitus]
MSKLLVTDTTLRDGSHAVSHSFSPEFVGEIVSKLVAANVPIIEVSHGAGLSGSTIQQGFSTHDEWKLIESAVANKKDSKIASLFVPGIGTRPEIITAANIGIDVLRIAVHCTEADVTQQYFEQAKKSGLETVGFLMMSHTQPASVLAEQAKLMESYGADCVYIVDSAGALVPEGVRERVAKLKESLSINVGFHAHNNLGLAIGNTIAALEAGANQVDGTLRGLGAGAGNAPTEVLVAVLNKMKIETGINLTILMDTAEEIIAPVFQYPLVIDRDNLAAGYAGVYNSFLLHVREAAAKFNINPVSIIEELGRRHAVAGQEDWILDVAIELAQKQLVR